MMINDARPRSDQEMAASISRAYREDVSARTGFLCSRVPVHDLPPDFDRYVETALRVPELVDAGRGPGARPGLDARFCRAEPRLLDAIDGLDEPHLWKAMTVFTYLAHAYRWSTIPPTPEERERVSLVLPEGVERPWRRLAARLGVPISSGFWNGLCHNWRLAGKRGGELYDAHELTIDTVSIVHLWLDQPNREHCERFYLAILLSEARGAEVASGVVEAVAAAAAGDETGVRRALERIRLAQEEIFKAFSSILRRSSVRVDIWTDYIAPFLGWGIESPGEGVLYGGSGMHLCTFEALNITFGLSNESLLGRETVQSRRYMLPAHRRFLAALEGARALLPGFVRRSGDPQLRDAWNACVESLHRWRVMHQKRGSMYLRGGNEENTVSPVTSTGGMLEPGTQRPIEFEAYMEERIQETQAARIEPALQGGR